MDTRVLRLISYLFILFSLAACSSFNDMQTDSTVTAQSSIDQNSKAVAGKFESSMDGLDKTKLSRALDKGLGKPTDWKNGLTGVHYTVVPVKKLTVNNNTFCRKYDITASKGEKTEQLSGVACLGEDGAWHPVNS